MRILKSILFVSVILFSGLNLFSQNYIGMHKDEIKESVRKELPGFQFTKEVFNNDRSFVKYENLFEEQTLVFMLNSNGYCTSISRMYNTWLFNKIKQELEEKHGKSKTFKWNEVTKGQNFEIELIKGEWFVTVVTRRGQGK